MSKAKLPPWVRRRLEPHERYGLRVTLFAVATLLMMLPFSWLLVQVTSRGPLTAFDSDAARSIHDAVRDSPPLIGLSHVISFLGGPAWFYPTVGLAALFFWQRRRVRIAVFLVVTNLVGAVLNALVKLLVDRPRPELEDPITHASGRSFPSGHTMASTIGYGSLLLAFLPLAPPRWRRPLLVSYFGAVVLVAASRLSLGVHFVSDVLGGFVLGMAWLAVSVAAFSIWRTEEGKPPVDIDEGIEPEAAED